VGRGELADDLLGSAQCAIAGMGLVTVAVGGVCFLVGGSFFAAASPIVFIGGAAAGIVFKVLDND
jgi:hypothetical protein